MAATRHGRRLESDQDPWTHNAWDDVDWNDEQVVQAETFISKQKENPVPPEQQEKYAADQPGHWNRLYSQVHDKMYSDRSWLTLEFDELHAALAPQAGPRVVVEIGSGPGNSFLPLAQLNQNPELEMHALDFSSQAIDILRADPRFQKPRLHAEVFDLASTGGLPPSIAPHSVDVALMVFVLSALSPQQWEQAVRNVLQMLKPGGILYFRDFGRYDLCQLRLKKERWLSDNFYVRGDGTQVYFFELDELRRIFGGVQHDGQQLQEMDRRYDRRLLLNRKRQLKMYRVWCQGSWRCTPVEAAENPA